MVRHAPVPLRVERLSRPDSVRTAPGSADAVSITRYLGSTGLGLWALVMALQPDAGFLAPLGWTALFWALQIGVGLIVLQSTLYLMSRIGTSGRWPLLLLVIGSGLVGSAVLSPLYWLIGEGLMQEILGFAPVIDDDPDVSLYFGLAAMAEEFANIVAPVTAAWLLISWPRLQGLLPPLVTAMRVSAVPLQLQVPPVPEQNPPAQRAAWREALPAELGDDLIAVSSELQYLRVWTSRGSTLVLGALQEVEDAEGAAGMRIHRSWWVHARHVRGVRGRGDGAICELSDGREVPVSRRRKAEVLARFGAGARYNAGAAAPVLSAESGQNTRRSPS